MIITPYEPLDSRAIVGGCEVVVLSSAFEAMVPRARSRWPAGRDRTHREPERRRACGQNFAEPIPVGKRNVQIVGDHGTGDEPSTIQADDGDAVGGRTQPRRQRELWP